jgi:hypothetical protein
MKYVAFVGTDGPQPEEAVAVMNRDFPAYLEEIDGRGVRLCGRELDFAEKAVTVRVRDGETLVSDGPFAETKEFVGGFDLLECVDLDEAIEVEAKSPVARFLPFEIRPFREGLRLGPGASAFARGDDSAGIPYLLMVWVDGTPEAPQHERAVMQECEAWRQELEGRGVFVLGNALGGPETATTMRFRDGEIHLSHGPFLNIKEFIAGIEVVSCVDHKHAIELAAAHPSARYNAIEVRPFYSESGPQTGAEAEA